MARAKGSPNRNGRNERFLVVVSDFFTWRTTFLIPSRLRKSIVLRMSSNCIAAVPYAFGDTNFKSARLKIRVKTPEDSRRNTETTENARDALSNILLVNVDLLSIMEGKGKRSLGTYPTDWIGNLGSKTRKLHCHWRRENVAPRSTLTRVASASGRV